MSYRLLFFLSLYNIPHMKSTSARLLAVTEFPNLTYLINLEHTPDKRSTGQNID